MSKAGTVVRAALGGITGGKSELAFGAKSAADSVGNMFKVPTPELPAAPDAPTQDNQAVIDAQDAAAAEQRRARSRAATTLTSTSGSGGSGSVSRRVLLGA
jgi:hypothetical protein